MELHQLDINNAFLHGYIDEDLYMHPPLGYTKAKPGQVCKLKRSIYGLKQASRQWNLELTKFLLHLGFQQSKYDYSMFTLKTGDSYIIVVAYVDDLLLAGTNLSCIQQLKTQLHDAFTIKDLGPLKYFLGIEVSRDSTGILLNQRKYILDLLHNTAMLDCKVADCPLPQGLKLSTQAGDLLPDPEVYRRIIGKLLYLNMTRPDISFAVQQLSQFLSAPRTSHFLVAQHVLRYLKGTLHHGLLYSADSTLQIHAYCDADWGACIDSARSLTGYCVFLGTSLISWKTKKQKVVSKSSTEAEYRSMSHTTSELTWITNLLSDLHISIPTPIPLFCDNKAAQHIAANPCFLERTKHLHIDVHYIRENVASGFIATHHVSSHLQLADVLTKSLGASHHKLLIFKLGLVFPDVSPIPA
ncbi:uncharacterized mitochondrial protein AtMg00810-like [Beta vulgaris subsp. vulgaris]|uniref:uncharacterized mitochondrial protein AtMg00810-like n=1 Tax=Beta vulgaris subsp. vulgaris TaxID=3555 RepID=UPI00090159C1|nr:uncharacterized mitochondrial protein AtMg00810-like [Beta vulgaris subsp. vulgaris]